MYLSLLYILLAFPLCALVPGFIALRRFDLPDELRLGVAAAVSLWLLFLAGFAFFLLGAGPTAHAVTLLAVVAATVRFRAELLAFLRLPAVSPLLAHYAIFTLWLLALSAVTRNFSGGGWSGDWLEHYERAVFFLGGQPADTLFIETWPLTARPPLHNVVVAFFLSLAGNDFPAYQLTAVLAASPVFLGAASLLSALTPERPGARRGGLLALTVLMCLNPSVVQNATLTWTRPLTYFFVLQSAALYLSALRDGSTSARRWSYLLLGMAMVTHYSTVPYVIAIAVVEAWFAATRRLAPREIAAGLLLGAAPGAPWLAFALHRFGLAGTALTNNTAEVTAWFGASQIIPMAIGNTWRTIVPPLLREFRPLLGDVPVLYEQPYVWGYVRDYAFLVYQQSLLPMMGSAGGLVVVWLLAAAATRSARARALEPTALAATAVLVIVAVGIGCILGVDPYGVGHVCLQPLAVAGLVVLAARWRELPAWLRVALGVGLLVDVALGIGLQFWMQHLTLADVSAMNPSEWAVSGPMVNSLALKRSEGFLFLGDLPGGGVASAIFLLATGALVVASVRRSAPAAAEPGP